MMTSSVKSEFSPLSKGPPPKQQPQPAPYKSGKQKVHRKFQEIFSKKKTEKYVFRFRKLTEEILVVTFSEKGKFLILNVLFLAPVKTPQQYMEEFASATNDTDDDESDRFVCICFSRKLKNQKKSEFAKQSTLFVVTRTLLC